MKEYNLCDIHFHTNNSFDGFKSSIHFNINDISNMLKGDSVTNNVKLVCFTDHNYFKYNDYLNNASSLKTSGIKCLPGIEVNTTNNVHWIIIFDDERLKENDKNGVTIGTDLENAIIDFYHYVPENPSDSSTEILKQTERAQLNPIDIIDFINKINELEIEYIAIPHFDKKKGWYEKLWHDSEQLELLELFIRDNIVFGLEGKQIKESLNAKIKKTQEFMDGYAKLLEQLDNGDEEKKNEYLMEINKRKELIKNFHKIDELADMSTIIYGSDYHGKDSYDKSKLFIMKSECSFSGLKFALLDPDSRIFSIDKYNKYLKSNNYIIDKISIAENGVDKDIILGDGLNCIIGSRGSGKTYFLSMLTGDTTGYTTISQSISLNNINYNNGTQSKVLDPKMFDYVAQKNNSNSKYGKKTSLYDLLSRAPYDHVEFESELNKFFQKVPSAKTEIRDFIFKCNELIKLFDQKKLSQDKSIDLDFIDAYNDYFSTEDINIKITELISNFHSFLSNKIKGKNTDIESINKFIEEHDAYIIELKKVFEISEIKKLISEEDREHYLNEFKGLIETIRNKGLISVDTNKKRLSIVQNRVSSILNKINMKQSNIARTLNDSVKNLSIYIKEAVTILRNIKNKYGDIMPYDREVLTDENLYFFEQGNNVLKVRIEKKIDFKDILPDVLMGVFGNYKYSNGNQLKNVFKQMIFSVDYGKHYLEKVKPFKDNRKNSHLLNAPELEPIIYLTDDSGVEKKWFDLSPGQRSDMLLKIILLNENNKILIIDQPEDDLDNETIFKKIVKEIRKLKLKRQIIIVTHNANMAITADCDYFIICEAKDDQKYAIINDTMESLKKYDYSSINNITSLKGTALEIATEILDGGKEALKKRVRKVGYKNLFLE